jgi:putative phage-type endonuclease
MNIDEDPRVTLVRQRTLNAAQQRSLGWEQKRAGMLTATDIPTILGVNPYQTSDELILRKLGKSPKFEGNIFTQWGNAFEDVAMFQVYKKLFDVSSEIIQVGLVDHTDIPFLGASPDFILPQGKIVEIKCPFKRRVSGVVPEHYYPQVQLQLEVCNLDIADFFECEFHKQTTVDIPGYEFINGNTFQTEFHTEPITGIVIMNNEPMAWYLERCSVVSVHRDHEWFNKHLPIIKQFFDTFLDYKKNPEKLDILYRSVYSKKTQPLSSEILFIDI